MGAVKNAVARVVEHALQSEGRDSVDATLGVLQELPVDLADALTVTRLAAVIEAWLEDQPKPPAPVDWRAVAVADLAALELADCGFWACEGPDNPPRGMSTCHRCWRLGELRALLSP